MSSFFRRLLTKLGTCDVTIELCNYRVNAYVSDREISLFEGSSHRMFTLYPDDSVVIFDEGPNNTQLKMWERFHRSYQTPFVVEALDGRYKLRTPYATYKNFQAPFHTYVGQPEEGWLPYWPVKYDKLVTMDQERRMTDLIRERERDGPTVQRSTVSQYLRQTVQPIYCTETRQQ